MGTSIAVLLDCSKSSRQCSLSYLLTYFPNIAVLLDCSSRLDSVAFLPSLLTYFPPTHNREPSDTLLY